MKNFDVTVDLELQTYPQTFSISQNDLNSISINLTLVKDGAAFDITGTTPRIAIKTPSGKTVLQDCSLVDPVQGKFSLDNLSTQAYIETGIHIAEIYLYDGPKTGVTGTFTYTSKKAILNDQTTEASNDWQSINGALVQLDEISSQMNTDIERIENISLAGKVDKISGKGLSTNDYDNTEKAEVAKVKDKANQSDVGNLANLTTTDKTSLVNAVNENVALLSENTQQTNNILQLQNIQGQGVNVND